MKEDVLATYKTEIGNSTEYVLRTDSTTDFNGEITDTTYPATTDIVSESYSLSNIFTTDLSVGCYIVGIILEILSIEKKTGILYTRTVLCSTRIMLF